MAIVGESAAMPLGAFESGGTRGAESSSPVEGLERVAVWEGMSSAGGTMAQRRGCAEGEGSLVFCATCA